MAQRTSTSPFLVTLTSWLIAASLLGSLAVALRESAASKHLEQERFTLQSHLGDLDRAGSRHRERVAELQRELEEVRARTSGMKRSDRRNEARIEALLAEIARLEASSPPPDADAPSHVPRPRFSPVWHCRTRDQWGTVECTSTLVHVTP
jgi:septal ring factor EnvC (AmiA/AmiB activator)